jgi:hypothetical protein
MQVAVEAVLFFQQMVLAVMVVAQVVHQLVQQQVERQILVAVAVAVARMEKTSQHMAAQVAQVL